jgi:biotin-(acetyl-CoA carboxylase) ligase
MPVGAIVHRFAAVPSTNDTARALALDGAAHAGVWQNRPGGAPRRLAFARRLRALCPFVLRGPRGEDYRSPISSAAGWPLRTPSGGERVETRLKWPNDIVLRRSWAAFFRRP